MSAGEIARGRIRSAWESPAFRWLLVLGMGMAFLLPRHIDYIQSGLDPSWTYAINLAAERGWKFGEDIVFTRGPLGFLASTCGVGVNIQLTLLATGILWLSQLWLLGRAVRARPASRLGTGRLLVATLLLWALPRPPFDSYLLYLVLLALSVAWFADDKRAGFVWACLLTIVQAFVMLASALSCAMAIGMFWVLWRFKDRAAWRSIRWLPLLVPAGVVAGYLCHNPSLAGLRGYLEGAGEIMGGYSAAMSLVEDPLHGWLTLAVGGLYAAVWVRMALGRRPTADYVLMFAGCFWVAMKHGLVRVDMWHLDAALCAMVPMFSLMLVFVEYRPAAAGRNWKPWALAGGAALILLATLPAGRVLAGKAKAYLRTVYGPNWSRIASWRKVGDQIANPRRGDDRLPGPILEAVGTNSVAFYPLELSFAAFNDVHFEPMPVLQAYSAYTPPLDALNAGFFRAGARAPKFVVMSLRTLDGRWPLIESPLAWTAIHENYDVRWHDGSSALLERRPTPRRFESRVLSDEERGTGDEIPLPATDGLVFIRCDMRLNLRGRIARIFHQIPPRAVAGSFCGRPGGGGALPARQPGLGNAGFIPAPAFPRGADGGIHRRKRDEPRDAHLVWRARLGVLWKNHAGGALGEEAGGRGGRRAGMTGTRKAAT